MDNTAQNPLDPNNQGQLPQNDNGLTPPTTPMQGGLTNTDTIPPSPQEPQTTAQSSPLTAEQLYAPSTPADIHIQSDIPTPPQESLSPQDPVQDLSALENTNTPTPPPAYEPPAYAPPAPYQPEPQVPTPTPEIPQTPDPNYQSAYQDTSTAYGQPPAYQQPAVDYSQPQQQEYVPQPTPPTPPPPPQKSSPKGFIIGGLLALIVVAAIFAVLMLANKNSDEELPSPSTVKNTPAETIPTPIVTPTPAPTTVSTPTLTPLATPKTVETFTNSAYKYKFEYALGLPAPKKVEPDPTRFPKALEVVTLKLSTSASASTSANFIVWDNVNDVPKYITDGQNQFVKVNIYTTNRFTIKKPDNTEETHYLTQKFDNTYDIMLQNEAGKISDPAFEKLLNSFTFLEDTLTQSPSLPSTGLSGNISPTATPLSTSPSPAAITLP